MSRFLSLKILILGVCAATSAAFGGILKGHVVDASNNPIAGAMVSLVKKQLTTTTYADGEFLLTVQDAGTAGNSQPVDPCNTFRLRRDGTVVFDLAAADHVEINLFDRSGRLVTQAYRGFSERGRHRIPLACDGRSIADQVYVLVISTSSGKTARTVVHTSGGFSGVSSLQRTGTARALGKTAYAIDTLIIKKSGYFLPDTLQVLSFEDHDYGNIALKPVDKSKWITFSAGSLDSNEWGGKQTTWCDGDIGGKSSVKIGMVDQGGGLGYGFKVTYNVADGGLGWMAALGIVQFPARDITAYSTLNFKIKGDFTNGTSFNVTMVSPGADGGFRTEFSIDKVHILDDTMTDVSIPLNGSPSWNPTTGPAAVFDPKNLVEIQFKVWKADVPAGSSVVVDDIRFE